MTNAAKKMAEAMTVREIAGWPLAFAANDDEPRIGDLALAERLGYAQPRDVRKLIKRMVRDGKLVDVHVRATVERTSMPRGGFRESAADAYWLTEGQALKVSAKSETDPADALLDEMIHVFMLARRGLLARPANDDALAALVAEMREIKAHVATLAIEAGTVTGMQADWITGEIDALASMRVMLGYNPTVRAAKTWIQKRVDAAAEWSGTGTSRRNMPAGRLPRVKVCLAQMRSDLDAEARRRDPRGKGSVALLKRATASLPLFSGDKAN